MSDNDEYDEIGVNVTNNDLVDYSYEDGQIEYESLNVQSEEKSKVYPQQMFLANHLLRRIKYVQKDLFKKYKRIDFQVSSYFFERLVIELEIEILFFFWVDLYCCKKYPRKSNLLSDQDNTWSSTIREIKIDQYFPRR